MGSRHLQTLIAVFLSGLWGAAVYFAHERGHLGFLARIESAMTDLRTLARGVRVPPDFVTIVAIDDTTVEQGGSYPLARIDLARIVDAIARLQPKVIAIDLVLVDRGSDDGDEALARSLMGRPSVIAAAAVFAQASQPIAAENGPLARLPRAERFLLPLKRFADHAEIGIANVTTDRGGTPSSIPMLFRTHDSIEMSFSLRAAALAIGKEPTIEPNRLAFGERSVATDADHALPVTFYGPRRTMRTLSAASVLAGEVAADDIRERIFVVVAAAANVFAFSRGIWLSAALPIFAAAPPAILFAGVQLWSGRRRAQYFAIRSELLAQFQAPDIREWLIRDPGFLKEPVRQDAAVVFIDLSGFTSLSESLGPDRIRELLKGFHAMVDKEAVSSGGMINSYLGDGAMILFGLPQAASDDPFRAAQCARGLCVSTQRWLASLPPAVRSRLGFKVGAHFGTIVASRLGGGSYHHITATGATVNVASRLMEVAAGHEVELALSDELFRAVGRDRSLFEAGVLTGPVETRLRGRSGSLDVWFWRSRSESS